MAGNDNDGKIKLIQGIEDDAKTEAEKILEQTEKTVQEKKDAVAQQIGRILSEAEAKAGEQAGKIRRNSKSAITVETKKLSLKVRDQLIASTIEKVRGKIYKLIGTDEYPSILSGWIVEAAMGLDASPAVVNTSRDEQSIVTDSFLKEAENTLLQLTGRKVKLVKSADDPLLAQGVVLSAQDGKTAFSNQIHTRILRYQTEMRKMIQEVLLSPGDTFF